MLPSPFDKHVKCFERPSYVPGIACTIGTSLSYFSILLLLRYGLGRPVLCYVSFSARQALPPPRGTVGSATFPFRVGFRLSSSRTPSHAGGPREGVPASFPHHCACVFLQSPFFVSPPARHAGGPQEVFDGGLPYHSACVFLRLHFLEFFLAS